MGEPVAPGLEVLRAQARPLGHLTARSLGDVDGGQTGSTSQHFSREGTGYCLLPAGMAKARC